MSMIGRTCGSLQTFKSVASKTRALKSVDFDLESLKLFIINVGVLLLALFSKSRGELYDQSRTFMDLWITLGLLDLAV